MFIRINVMLNRMSADLAQGKYSSSTLKNEKNESERYKTGDSIGRSLHNIYCGMESILKDIANEIDNSKPSGQNFHKMLLEQMAASTNNRPAIINLTSELKDLLGFRHVFRNVYGEPFRLDEMVEKMHTVEHSILPEFIQGLENLRVSLETDIENPFVKTQTGNDESQASESEGSSGLGKS